MMRFFLSFLRFERVHGLSKSRHSARSSRISQYGCLGACLAVQCCGCLGICYLRGVVRQKYSIQESCINDLLCSCCCPACSETTAPPPPQWMTDPILPPVYQPPPINHHLIPRSCVPDAQRGHVPGGQGQQPGERARGCRARPGWRAALSCGRGRVLSADSFKGVVARLTRNLNRGRFPAGPSCRL